MPDYNINVQNNYLTYEYIVNIFKTLQEETVQLQSFLCGPMEDIDISKMGIEKYPLLYIEPTGITINNFVQEYTFDVAVLNFVTPADKEYPQGEATVILSESQQVTEVLSTTQKPMQDIISSFIQNLNSVSWVNTEVDLQLPINLSPILAQYDNALVGWSGTFTITANNKNDLCNSNIFGNTP